MGELIATKQRSALIELDNTLRDCQREIAEARQDGNQMVEAFATAEAMARLRELMTEPLMKSLMRLMNSPLGFKTDRDSQDKSKYTPEQVRDPMIEGMIRGFRPVGNEINIIAGNFYATKQGMERVVREYPGLTDLRLVPGVPHASQDGALVTYQASWKLNGQDDAIECLAATAAGTPDTRLAVRVNKGMGIDAILGKAKAKMLKRIYERLTGSVQFVEDDAIAETSGPLTSPPFDEVQTEKVEQADSDTDLQIAKICDEAIASINVATEVELIDRIAAGAVAAVEQLGNDGALIKAAVRVRKTSLKVKT